MRKSAQMRKPLLRPDMQAAHEVYHPDQERV
jgi:hypothetical protein